MYCFSLAYLPKFPTGKRLWLCFNFLRVSTCCAVECSSSDDNVTLVLDSYTELRQIMQRHATSGSISKALSTLNIMRNVPGRPTVCDFNSMITCYFRCGNVVVDELFHVYGLMKKYGPLPNLSTYDTLLNGLISYGFLKDGIWMVKEMIASNFYPSYMILSTLFKKLLKGGNFDLDSVLKVLEMMLRYDYMPSHFDVSILVQGLCKDGMIYDAYVVFSSIVEREYVCGRYIRYIYNHILWGLCKSDHHMYNALSFFGLLKKKGFLLNLRSYNALVYGFSKNKLWSEAYSCFDKMESAYCKPSTVTFTIVIKFLCEDGQVGLALRILEKMKEMGSDPDLFTYNIILRELSHQGRVNEIDDLVRIIDQKGLLCNEFTHAALAGDMLKRGKVEMGYKYVHDIILSNGSPQGDIYLHSVCLYKGSKEALCTLQSMIENDFTPTNASYNIILKGLCQENNMDGALKLIDSPKWPLNGPNLISFNTILSAACKQGNPSMIRQILWRMEYKGIRFDVISSNSLLRYYCTFGKIQECLAHLDSMVSKGPRPNTTTLNTVLDGLCKKQSLGIAKQIFNNFKAIGIPPDIGTYNILMSSSVQEGNDLLLDELSRDMYTQKVKPDVYTYRRIIHILCVRGNISLALRLCDGLLENGIPPNILIYNTLMEAMLRRGMLWQIISLFEDMEVDRCEPNEDSFDLLRHAARMGWMKHFPRAVNIIELAMYGKFTNLKRRHLGDLV